MQTRKRWWQRSIVSGLILLVLAGLAAVVEAWGTEAFWGVVRAQIAAVLLGLGEMIRRQRKDPSSKAGP